MTILGILLLVIQVGFAIHAIKHGHGYMWVMIVLLFPAIGCLIYFIVIVMPEMSASRPGRKTASVLKKTLDPERDLRRHSQNLEISDSITNKAKLAEELLTSGRPLDAIDVYEKSLTGIYHDDSTMLLGLAHAYFQAGRFQQTQETLDKLIQAHPDFKSQAGHLLYARALEGLEETSAATEEYESLASYFTGPEAKCRYALFLKKLGQLDEANKLFNDILLNARHSPQYYQKLYKEWIAIAKTEMA